jgi:hypothetical protein
MPPRRKSGGGSSAGPGGASRVPAELVPAALDDAPAVVGTTDKYSDANPNEAVVAVNEAHMMQVNNAVDIVREAMPGGAGKDS